MEVTKRKEKVGHLCFLFSFNTRTNNTQEGCLMSWAHLTRDSKDNNVGGGLLTHCSRGKTMTGGEEKSGNGRSETTFHERILPIHKVLSSPRAI